MLFDNITTLENNMFLEKEGTIVLSSRDSENGTSIIVSDEHITLTNNGMYGGISVSDQGIVIQGDVFFTAEGTSIKKGNYSENPNSAKIFTYTETIELEANAKEKLVEVASKLGINTGELTKGGIMQLMTNVGGSAGIAVPHVHTMMFKHVHRVEPAYLYRIPNAIKIFTGAFEPIYDFFKTLGS